MIAERLTYLTGWRVHNLETGMVSCASYHFGGRPALEDHKMTWTITHRNPGTAVTTEPSW